MCSTANTYAILSDERFDFSDAYIISTGCAGSAEGYGVMGDVYVITAAVDYDLVKDVPLEKIGRAHV